MVPPLAAPSLVSRYTAASATTATAGCPREPILAHPVLLSRPASIAALLCASAPSGSLIAFRARTHGRALTGSAGGGAVRPPLTVIPLLPGRGLRVRTVDRVLVPDHVDQLQLVGDGLRLIGVLLDVGVHVALDAVARVDLGAQFQLGHVD